MERLPPPKPRRNQDALRQAPGPAPVSTQLRPIGRRVPGPCRRPERLHRPGHAHHRGRGVGLSGEGELRPSPDLCNRAVWSLKNAQNVLKLTEPSLCCCAENPAIPDNQIPQTPQSDYFAIENEYIHFLDFQQLRLGRQKYHDSKMMDVPFVSEKR